MRTATRHWSIAALALLIPAVAALTAGCSAPDEQRRLDSGGAAAGAVTNVAPQRGDTAEPVQSTVATTATPPAPLPPPPPARDADQAFLRQMLDHHETTIALAHTQMMSPAGHAVHGVAGDPVALDSRLDAEKQEMLALLSRFYGESYSPRTDTLAAANAHAEASVPTGGAAMPPAGGSKTMPMMDVGASLRRGATLVDQHLPRLKRAEVRALAGRMRASQLALAGQMDAPAAR